MDPISDAIIAVALGAFLGWVVFAVSYPAGQGYTTNCGQVGYR